MSLDGQLYQSRDVWAQPMQEGQRNLLRAMIDFWPANIESALDVGCGDGKLTRVLAAEKSRTKFVGLDSSSEALSQMPLESVLGNATALPFSERSFDLVMSTDALEHIPGEDESIAWGEIFRVAARHVMIAVPYKEELLDATARCSECQGVYHVNWHQRSYDIEALKKRAPKGWSISAIVLTGEPWSAMLPPETEFRRKVLDEWSGWEMAVCPTCGAQGEGALQPSALSRAISSCVGKGIYEILKSRRFIRSHSEVLAIYRSDQCAPSDNFFPETRVEELSIPASEIRFDFQNVAKDLFPYPQVARYVQGGVGQYRLQFPLYERTPELQVYRDPSSEGDVYLQLEDAEGLLFEGCILPDGVDHTTLSFDRPLVPTYYGVLGTCSSDAPISSLKLGSSPEIMRARTEDIGYVRLDHSEFPLFIQIKGEEWIDPLTILSPEAKAEATPNNNIGYIARALREKIEIQESLIRSFNQLEVADVEDQATADPEKPRVLMLCHDQHLDRRVIAQANTLVAAGYFVRLLALSFTHETVHETLPEGVEVLRIGLTNIVPENPTYASYLRRQQNLSGVLNLLTYHFPLGYRLYLLGFRLASKFNSVFYRISLLARYRNRGLHDPLPFRKAFFDHGINYPSDLVQVHDLPALEAGVQLAQSWGVPLVYDAHELYPEQRSFSSVQRKICSESEKRLIQHADLVFAVNESIGQEMAQRYGIAKPVTLLNAIDPPPEFDPNAKYDLLREKLSLSLERRILLFQGGFAPHRNLEALVEAMAYVKSADVDLVLMGFGDFGDLLRKKADSLRLMNNRVYFLPAVPQDQLLQHSASADLGVIPYPHIDLNSYYCTPNKLFEFIQAGLPILANDSPELRRFVRDNGFGHCAPMSSPKEIAKAIDAAFASPDLPGWRASIRAKRRELAWCAQGEIYLDAMRKVLPEGISRVGQILPGIGEAE